MVFEHLKKLLPRSVKNYIKKHTPERYRVSHYYYQKTGRTINLRSPQRFSEKLGWYKLYYRDELMRKCTDKAAVRDYVESAGYGNLLNECYGIYDNAEDIEWDKLPRQFAIKNTLGGSNWGNTLVFDKETLNIDELEKVVKQWLSISASFKSPAGEWVYEKQKPRIIVEKLLISSPQEDLPDYKFFCFNGKVFCSYLMRNYTMHPKEGENAFLDRDYKLLPVSRTDYKRIKEQPPKPKNYEKMIEIAETLSKPFPHARVDLYNLDGTIIFGELTFFTNSGVIPFDPDLFDYEMGDAFTLPKRNRWLC